MRVSIGLTLLTSGLLVSAPTDREEVCSDVVAAVAASPAEVPAPPQQTDEDADGLANVADWCWGTAPLAPVDPVGCAITDYCACEELDTHGAYQRCITDAVRDFVAQGLLERRAGRALRAEAAASECPPR